MEQLAPLCRARLRRRWTICTGSNGEAVAGSTPGSGAGGALRLSWGPRGCGKTICFGRDGAGPGEAVRTAAYVGRV
jgi:hypothetical protein